jgi:hypothetical protein
MVGREAGQHAGGVRAADRLFESGSEAVLVTPGGKCHPCRRAHRGIGIGLVELQALAGKLIEHGRLVIAPAITAEIGKTEIVGKNEEDVGALPRRSGRADCAR